MTDDHWLEIADLSIFDAGYWMVVNGDPRDHHHLFERGDEYAERVLECFDNQRGGREDVEGKCELLLSAVRAQKIRVTKQPSSDEPASYSSIFIDKDSWLEWCKSHGYTKASMNFPIRSKRFGHSTGDIDAEVSNVEPDWRDRARTIADELFDHDTQCGTRDTLMNYANRVMKKMQERQIHGPRGRIDNPKTIQREALQGHQWWATKPK